MPRSATTVTGSLASVAATSASSPRNGRRGRRAPAASRAGDRRADPRLAPVTMAVRRRRGESLDVIGDVDRHRVDDHVVVGRSLRVRRHPLHLVEHVEALDHLAEQAVQRRQADAARAGDDEELAAVGVRTGVGHRHRADLVAAGLGQLVVEPVAGAAGAGAGRVAALAHEAVDDAVEDHAVVVVVEREEDEVVDGLRGAGGVERDDQSPSDVSIVAV